jgi:hypothetical protein
MPLNIKTMKKTEWRKVKRFMYRFITKLVHNEDLDNIQFVEHILSPLDNKHPVVGYFSFKKMRFRCYITKIKGIFYIKANIASQEDMIIWQDSLWPRDLDDIGTEPLIDDMMDKLFTYSWSLGIPDD